METPRTDEILETVPHRDCNDNSQEAFEIMLEHARKLERELSELAAENRRLRIALHEAINRPKGIVPHEAEEFYDQDFYSITTARQGVHTNE